MNLLKEIGARSNIEGVKKSEHVKKIILLAKKELEAADKLPDTSYTLFSEFQKTGVRENYERPHFLKRRRLTAAVICALFANEEKYIDLVNDYIVSICEETTWVWPAHGGWAEEKIDLFATETGLILAETILLLDKRLPDEIVKRVKEEINKRIFNVYLEHYRENWWYKGPQINNWAGVCNGSVGATFLYLEKNKKRLSKAIKIVLKGLKIYIDRAFEKDGGSTEGTAYWSYGLINYVVFSELLRKRTRGKIDLLSMPIMKGIAQYPPKMMLSPGSFINFSDCGEEVGFYPGIIAKMAERTKTPELLFVLSGDDSVKSDLTRLPMVLRDIFWWDGKRRKASEFSSANKNVYLPLAQVVKLVSKTRSGKDIIVAAKAGHNAENHNQNDVGSFILHAGGETFLCDPGYGLYSKDYFINETRYDNIFTNSFGHSLPVINGKLQKNGRKYAGEIKFYEPGIKRVEVEFGKAYGLSGIKSINRVLCVSEDANEVILEDSFVFEKPMKIQEAFVTWLPVRCAGNKAYISGKKGKIELTVNEPKGTRLSLKELKKECMENKKEKLLRRIYFDLPAKLKETKIKIQMEYK